MSEPGDEAGAGSFSLLELLSAVIDNRGRTCPVLGSGIPLIATNCIGNDALFPKYDTQRYVSEITYNEWFRGHPRPGDLIFVTKGSPGRVCIAPNPVDFCIAQDMVALRPDPDKVYPRFLFALLRSARVQRDIEQMHVGTLIPHFKKGDFDKLVLKLPPSHTQRFVGDLYYLLSAKIELNRKLSATLEALARALFKSWFVDFDPVSDKSEGRLTGQHPDIAALFSDGFVSTNWGKIPKGWQLGNLGEIVSQRLERCSQSDETMILPYVPIDCISSNCLLLSSARPGAEAKTSLSKFRKGDILFGAMRPYFHKVCVAPFDGTTRTTVFVLTPKRQADLAFATMLIHEPSSVEYATAHSTGSTIPYAVWSDSFERLPIVIPPPELRTAFSDVISSTMDRISAMHYEQAALMSLRDTLLPKLISGELRIRESQRSLEKSA